MELGNRQTRENIRLKEYRWGQFILSWAPALLWHAVSTVIGWTLHEELEGKLDRSQGAPIIVVFHQEFPITLAAQRTWRKVFRNIGWVGIHNWISYVTSFICWRDGLTAVRYDRRTGKKPLVQVLEFLKQNTLTPFAMRTDSGGPYGRVRTSVVRLALEANRPIVCVRQSTDRCFTVKGHSFPLPFARVLTRVSSPLLPQTIAHLTVEEATARVQFVMNYLGESPALRVQLVPAGA